MRRLSCHPPRRHLAFLDGQLQLEHGQHSDEVGSGLGAVHHAMPAPLGVDEGSIGCILHRCHLARTASHAERIQERAEVLGVQQTGQAPGLLKPQVPTAEPELGHAHEPHPSILRRGQHETAQGQLQQHPFDRTSGFDGQVGQQELQGLAEQVEANRSR